jgi:hypothetical protein
MDFGNLMHLDPISDSIRAEGPFAAHQATPFVIHLRQAKKYFQFLGVFCLF